MELSKEDDKKRNELQSDPKYDKISLTLHPLRWMAASVTRYRKCVLFMNIIVIILLLVLVGKSGMFGAEFHFSKVNRESSADHTYTYTPHFKFWNHGLGTAHDVHVNIKIYYYVNSGQDFTLKFKGYDVPISQDENTIPGRFSGHAAELEFRLGAECRMDTRYYFKVDLVWDDGSQTFFGSFK